MRGISVWVDRLTRSIEDAQTGERFETAVIQLGQEDARQFKKKDFKFDWGLE